MKRYLFVVNPVSGDIDKDDIVARFQSLCKNHQIEASEYFTTGEEDEKALRKQLEGNPPEQIFVGGGDGTVQMVSNVLDQTAMEIPLAIVPLGSANGLATSLQLPAEPKEAMELGFEATNIQALDILKVNDQYTCLHLFDLGTNARLIKYYDEGDSRGMLGYAKQALKAILDSESVRYTIETEKGKETQDGLVLICTNATRFGTGVNLTNGDPGDGLLDVRVIEDFTLEEIIHSSLSIFDIYMDEDRFEDTVQSAKVTIRSSKPVPLQIDGEYLGETQEVTAEVIPAALKMVMPDA